MAANPLRRLPSVDALLRSLPEELRRETPQSRLVAAARAILADARALVRSGAPPPSPSQLRAALEQRLLAASAPPLRPVINATGVILHTNLGRAPLSEMAVEAMARVAKGYSNLEFDLETGARGSRHDHLRPLLREVTGAEDGLVVNNNAAGVFFALSVFARGKEVLVSRGQAVEIGGGFRIPDVLRASGARLVEVGTTNRTYVRDYEEALGPETAALLRVHASNFRVVGFTAVPTLEELARLVRRAGILLFDDLGSGALIDTRELGLDEEPRVQDSVQAGADLVFFSGDKLLGGPQCGIVVGRAELVAKLRAHPLARALRVDKLTIAALAETLRAYAEGRHWQEIPVLRMLRADTTRQRRWARRWARAAGEGGAVVTAESFVGGGSLPGSALPTACAALSWPQGAEELARELRKGSPPIVGRIESNRVLLDPRAVPDDAARAVEERIRHLFGTSDC